MHVFLLLLLISCGIGSRVYEKSTEFDEEMREMIEKNGGKARFLRDLVDEDGFPKSLRSDGVKIPKLQRELKALGLKFCLNITDSLISDEKYANCPILVSKAEERTVLKVTGWDGFKLFKFAVDLVKLENIELRMEHQAVLTYLYFSSFRRCRGCLFNLSKNSALVGLRFPLLNEPRKLEKVHVKQRPRLKVRGNFRLKLSDSNKRADLKRICNPEECDIQEDYECYFRSSIRRSAEYANCRHVYGDMKFTRRFNESQPADMDFLIDGCFSFNRTIIRFVRPMLKARGNCSQKHVFEMNKYMCTDQIEELRALWGPKRVKVIKGDLPNIKCYQGECRGGFVHTRNADRYVGCELVRGDLYVTESSQNVSDRIRDLSNIHEIYGQLQLIGNPSVVDLGMPFLKLVRSPKCPAVTISGMRNLRNIIFHPHVVFECEGDGPSVVITNSPRIHLHAQMLKKLTAGENVRIDGFEYHPVHFYDDVTAAMVITGLVIIVIVEVLTALWRNLLLPTCLYRLFPVSVARRPKQKPMKNKRKYE